MAKQVKFRVFAYETEQGLVGTIKAPSKITEGYAKECAPHWIKVQRGLDLEVSGDKLTKIVGIK